MVGEGCGLWTVFHATHDATIIRKSYGLQGFMTTQANEVRYQIHMRCTAEATPA